LILRPAIVVLLTAGCASGPLRSATCMPQSFSCRGNQPAEPTEAREFVEQNTVVYPIVTELPPEQVAQTLCEQVLGPLGSASVLGKAISVQETPSIHVRVRQLLLAVDPAPSTRSTSTPIGLEPCALQNFGCRGRQPPDPTQAKKIAEPITVVYPVPTKLPAAQVAQTVCEQILTPFGSASVLGKSVSIQDTPGAHATVRQLFLNMDKEPSPQK
jgi:hypothetical protein